MAVGRGEFFQSFLQGLERLSAQPSPERGARRTHTEGPGFAGGPRATQRGRRERPGPAEGLTAPERGQAASLRRRRRWCPAAGRSAVSPEKLSCPEVTTQAMRAEFREKKTSRSTENFMERLPLEVLVKIFSFLDVSSLFSISQVSKLFHELANDDFMWHKIYTLEFGCHMWKPKLVDKTCVGVEDHSAGYWKKMYFQKMAGQEMDRWRRDLRATSPYTGLPQQTEWVLRNMNMSWELTVRDQLGQESTWAQTRMYYFESSVIVHFSSSKHLKYHHISTIQLHGVRKNPLQTHGDRKPIWSSLMLKLDREAQPSKFMGKGKLIRLRHLSPGFIFGIWRGQNKVAFIMISLHFHRLVEKSLLGYPSCPYSEPVDLPLVDHSDPEFGLHGYTLHFVLHNTGTEIMSGHFRHLSCRSVHIKGRLVQLRVINRSNLSQHRSLSGSIKMPWQCCGLDGSVENCCIMTLTLLDESQKPFWCVSEPICITRTKEAQSFDYSGDHFVMDHCDADGQVKMKLVWLKEQKQFFIISLTIYVSVLKINKRFGRKY